MEVVVEEVDPFPGWRPRNASTTAGSDASARPSDSMIWAALLSWPSLMFFSTARIVWDMVGHVPGPDSDSDSDSKEGAPGAEVVEAQVADVSC